MSISIELTEKQRAWLEDMASRKGLTVEWLASAIIAEQLDRDEELEAIAQRIVGKNTE